MADDGRRRILEGGRASVTASVADAVVLKQGELFFLCERNGDVPMDDAHGRLRVGDATASLTFARDRHGRVIVDDVNTDGTLDVTCDA
jgi:hypothetical protein